MRFALLALVLGVVEGLAESNCAFGNGARRNPAPDDDFNRSWVTSGYVRARYTDEIFFATSTSRSVTLPPTS